MLDRGLLLLMLSILCLNPRVQLLHSFCSSGERKAMAKNILFTSPASSFEPSFWEKLYDQKLNVLRLSTDAIPITGQVSGSDGKDSQSFKFSQRSFDPSGDGDLWMAAQGSLMNVNTIEDFTGLDKKELIRSWGLKILESIAKGNAIRDPSLLYRFLLLSFADLKAYKFVFWFAQPALVPADPFQGITYPATQRSADIKEPAGDRGLSPAVSREYLEAVYEHLLRQRTEQTTTPLPLIFAIRDKRRIASTSADASTRPVATFGFEQDYVSETAEVMAPPQPDTSSDVEIASLFEVWPERYDPHITYVVVDQSGQAAALGWAARNLLALLSVYSALDRSSYFLSSLFMTETDPSATAKKSIRILSLRNPAFTKPGFTSRAQSTVDWDAARLVADDASVYVEVDLPRMTLPDDFDEGGGMNIVLLQQSLFPQVIGWEPNERGRPGPKIADLRATLDARLLMTQAVDLNLRLMKWRQWPSLDLDRLRQQRCLLLGSGTLGCAVGRTLLGWGITRLTFVDNGTVSYSNPARQTLFSFADAEQGRWKAVAAAEEMKRIYPGMQSEAVVLSIPMPGHPWSTTTKTAAAETAGTSSVLTDDAARQRLEELVRDHDVIFLLTDSREARWLPTLLGKLHGKIVINAALGFDSYLVMHHGRGQGCYFCTDIVAAGNSQQRRPLDEQCTVTRPGLSFIAGALCVELLVALLQQPAPSATTTETETAAAAEVLSVQYDTETTAVPHQIRGNVLGFQQLLLEMSEFPHCTACSSKILEAYSADPSAFLAQVCTDPTILEEISGVRAMTEAVDLELCIDSDEEF